MKRISLVCKTIYGNITIANESFFQRNEEIEEGLRAFNVQKYVPRQSEESDVSDATVSDSESLNDASSSDTASDGNRL